MITLIGTGHVFDLSAALIDSFDKMRPDLICVELDRQRYQALLLRQSHPEQYRQARKNVPFVYRVLAQFQENMAQQYGVEVGSEMIAAIEYATSHQLPVEFIDVNAQQLFTKMWKSMPVSEKFRLLFSGIGSLFISKKKVEQELQNFQKDFDRYIEEIGNKFPTIKKVLIDDRNEYMAKKIEHFSSQFERIVVCLGDGHIPGIHKILKSRDFDISIIRLKDLRNMKRDGDVNSGHFSIEYKQE